MFGRSQPRRSAAGQRVSACLCRAYGRGNAGGECGAGRARQQARPDAGRLARFAAHLGRACSAAGAAPGSWGRPAHLVPAEAISFPRRAGAITPGGACFGHPRRSIAFGIGGTISRPGGCRKSGGRSARRPIRYHSQPLQSTGRPFEATEARRLTDAT